MTEREQAAGLTLVNASAGSGKTHRLTEEVVHAVGPNADERVDLEGLVAVTYTRKAAAELGARIRRALVGCQEHDQAQRLALAKLGTVHAVCLRLVQENAIAAGLSPKVDVLPGHEIQLMRQALEWRLTPELRKRIIGLSYRLQLRWAPQRRQTDWLTPVGDIMTLARSNRIPADALRAMADRALAGLLPILGEPERDGAALDQVLLDALLDVDARLGRTADDTKATSSVHETVREALKKAQSGALLWSDWVKLQKLKPGVASRDIVESVVTVAKRVDLHPRLHEELVELTRSLYQAAEEGLRAYQEWKTRRGVIDFVDMIDHALVLVETPDVANELAQRLELIVVDELQDTSPIQLALFLRLHELAGRSTWVGDPKQCIFEYAGADPVLMQAVTDWAAAERGKIERLDTNFRSRPELVDACSKIFAGAFANQGFGPEDVAVRPKRPTPRDARLLPPFAVWALDVENNDQEAAAMADGVQRMLASAEASPIADRRTGEVRNLRAADIAVLVATNAEAARIAMELGRRGIRASIAREGLLATPEGVFVEAALRRVLDRADTLAEAELSALSGFDDTDPDQWLTEKIEVAEGLRTSESGARLAALDAIRQIANSLSPSEVVDRVLSALDLAALAARWPDPEQRLANLDALRALAHEYEHRCQHEHESATIAGLLRYFAEAAEKLVVRDEEIASDHQHVTQGEHGVTLITYHRAKGLEWPVVVLGSLGRGPRRDAFDVTPATDSRQFNPTDPLRDRWIRYWPWPFGSQKTCAFADRAARSPEGLAIAERERRERVRLLYVGFTRARDHLVLALRRGRKSFATGWLDELAGEDGKPLVRMSFEEPDDEAETVVVCTPTGAEPYEGRYWVFGANDQPDPLTLRAQCSSFARPEQLAADGPLYRISPSCAQTDWPDLPALQVAEIDRYGARIPLGRAEDVTWNVVGDTLHAFFASDLPGLPNAVRIARAERLIDAANLRSLLAPDALLVASNELGAWINRRWPGGRSHREIPISARISSSGGTRQVDGVIDLLLETADGFVVLDYKSFPGASSLWGGKAAELAPQLAAYARALECTGARVCETWFCFPIGGGAVRVAL